MPINPSPPTRRSSEVVAQAVARVVSDPVLRVVVLILIGFVLGRA